MGLSRRWATVLIVLAILLLAASAEAVVLWKQVGGLQEQVVGLHSQLSALKKEISLLRQREAEDKRIDTSPKKSVWLLDNKLRLELGEITKPKGLAPPLKETWDESYSPRKGHAYDVAFVEWRQSGRSRRQAGEELVEVLWVASVINTSKAFGYDMRIDLEFLDQREFRIAKDRAQGYIFPKTDDDLDFAHETKLRGSFWVPLSLAKEIKRVSGVWTASPR